MSHTNLPLTPEEEEAPFVHEECGDTMWDAVLAQPANQPNPATSQELPPAGSAPALTAKGAADS